MTLVDKSRLTNLDLDLRHSSHHGRDHHSSRDKYRHDKYRHTSYRHSSHRHGDHDNGSRFKFSLVYEDDNILEKETADKVQNEWGAIYKECSAQNSESVSKVFK